MAPFRRHGGVCQHSLSTPWPPISPSTQTTSVSYSRRQPAGRFGGVTSGAASGCRRERLLSANPAFHYLRHSHAARLIAQGEHPKVIQERLGHASIKTTLDTYGHLFEGLAEAATDRLESTYAAADAHAMCTREGSEVIALAAE